MPKDCNHDSHELAALLVEPLREVARNLGYALGVHGTLKRDIDLIACPWTSEAVRAGELAEAIRRKAAEINPLGVAFIAPREDQDYQRRGSPGAKPHGRRVWSFHLGGGPYIDLSVMPRTHPAFMEGDDILVAMKEPEFVTKGACTAKGERDWPYPPDDERKGRCQKCDGTGILEGDRTAPAYSILRCDVPCPECSDP